MRHSVAPMAYSPEAVARRRCLDYRRDGLPCRAWAAWGEPRQLCSRHAGHTRGRRRAWAEYLGQPARYEPCRCRAYAWPHRPGGGWCRWPEEPLVRVRTPAGTHRYSGSWRRSAARGDEASHACLHMIPSSPEPAAATDVDAI